jgi:hypothetical protein
VGAKGAKLTNSEPAYEDSTDGLNPKIAAGGYCVGGNCTNLLPVCESFPKGGTGPISVTKYTVGDCISRSNAISLGQQTQGKELDYMANVTKEMGSGAAIIYTISDSMNWQDFYRSSISGAAQRVSNFKCPAPKGSIMVVAPEICPI